MKKSIQSLAEKAAVLDPVLESPYLDPRAPLKNAKLEELDRSETVLLGEPIPLQYLPVQTTVSDSACDSVSYTVTPVRYAHYVVADVACGCTCNVLNITLREVPNPILEGKDLLR